MATTIHKEAGGILRTVIQSPKKPKMADFELRGIDIENIDNGVVITARHRLKPDAEARLSKEGKGYVDYDSRYREVKKAFTSPDGADALGFIQSALTGKAEEGEDE